MCMYMYMSRCMLSNRIVSTLAGATRQSRATSRQLSYTRSMSMAAFAPTPHYVQGVEFGLFAKITDEETLANISNKYNSYLYLCADTAGDVGVPPRGFPALCDKFTTAGSVTHVPFVGSSEPFAVKPNNQAAAVAQYELFEAALDGFKAQNLYPTAISCGAAVRASCVFAAYKAVKEGMSAEAIHAYALEKNLGYTVREGMVAWVNTVVSARSAAHKNPLIFRQLFDGESSTYTYLLADSLTKECVLIDPVDLKADRDAALVRELGLTLKYAMNTHVHADHITGTGKLKALMPGCQSVISRAAGASADVLLDEHNRISFGSRSVYGLHTPGHTNGCFTYVMDDLSRAFTGDTLLIRGCGRTDFQGGSSDALYTSVHSKIFTLPSSTLLYPAHDYKGMTASSVSEEKAFNPRLTKTREEFAEIMERLQLPYPKKIDEALPANLNCGLP